MSQMNRKRSADCQCFTLRLKINVGRAHNSSFRLKRNAQSRSRPSKSLNAGALPEGASARPCATRETAFGAKIKGVGRRDCLAFFMRSKTEFKQCF